MAKEKFITEFITNWGNDRKIVIQPILANVDIFLDHFEDDATFCILALSPDKGMGFEIETSNLKLDNAKRKYSTCHVEERDNLTIYSNPTTNSVMYYIPNKRNEHIIIWKIAK